LENGRNGLVVELGNFDQLETAVSRLLIDTDTRIQLSLAAQQTVQDRYTNHTVSTEFTQLFQRVSEA
jgi:hypothetical protein